MKNPLTFLRKSFENLLLSSRTLIASMLMLSVLFIAACESQSTQTNATQTNADQTAGNQANGGQTNGDRTKPNQYYSTERQIKSVILALKNYDSHTIEVAAKTLSQNLAKNQKYQKITVFLDENYPSEHLKILENAFKDSFPESKYMASKNSFTEIQHETLQTSDTTTANDPEAANHEASLILVVSQYTLKEDDPEFLKFQKKFLKSSVDNFQITTADKLPYSNAPSLKALADFNLKQKNSKTLPILEDLEKGFIIHYFSAGEVFESKTAYLTFMGDLMLDRTVRKLMDRKGLDYPFQTMDQNYLKANDLLIANLEGPVAEKAVKTSKEIAFRFKPDIVPLLKKYHFDVLSLANNHTLDMGKNGLDDSYKFLQQKNLASFGHPKEINDETIYKTTVNGLKLAFIGFNDVDFKVKPDQVIAKIKALKKENYAIIIFPHWGVEYRHKPTEYQTKLAHDFIDAGATMVIGAHPHVVQSYENYKDHPIFYSLGNAMFDQYFSKETQEGLTISMELNENSVKIYLVPIRIDQSQMRLMNPEEKAEFLKRFADFSLEDEFEKEKLLTGIITINLK